MAGASRAFPARWRPRRARPPAVRTDRVSARRVGCARSLIYRLAVEILGPDTPKGREVSAAWQYPGFRRAFRVITVAWGVGYLVEVAARSVIVATTSTGIALICSKLLPYAFAISLAAWTLVYGEREKKRAEHLAAAGETAGTKATGGTEATAGTKATADNQGDRRH
jgi:hypothetical protein